MHTLVTCVQVLRASFALASRQLLVWPCPCTCAVMGWELQCRLSCVVWLLIKLSPKQPLFSCFLPSVLVNSPGLLGCCCRSPGLRLNGFLRACYRRMPRQIQVCVNRDALRTVGGVWFLTLRCISSFLSLHICPCWHSSCRGSFHIRHPHTRIALGPRVLVHSVLIGIPAFQLMS